MNPLNWLRRKAAEAVVLGVADGLAAVTPDGEAPADLDGLRKLAAEAAAPKALPAGEERKDARKRPG